jgi:hypothetical protein
MLRPYLIPYLIRHYITWQLIQLRKINEYINSNTHSNSHLLTLVPRSRISYTLKTEAIRSSETSVNTISTRRYIPEDGILQQYEVFEFVTICSIFWFLNAFLALKVFNVDKMDQLRLKLKCRPIGGLFSIYWDGRTNCAISF